MKTAKRILSSLLVFCLLAGFAPAAFAAEDVTEIVIASEEGITVGNVNVDGDMVAVVAESGDGVSKSVTVEGSVSDSAQSSATAINANSGGEGSSSTVSVMGDVTGKVEPYEGDEYPPYGSAVSASAQFGGSVSVSVGGDASFEMPQDGTGIIVNAYSITEAGTVDVEIGGSVSVLSPAGDVTGVLAQSEADYGNWDPETQDVVEFDLDSTSASSTVTVGGDITVNADFASGAVATTVDGGTAAVSIGGDVTTNATTSTGGVSVSARQNGSSSMTVDGAVNANASGEHATAVDEHTYDGGTANVSVGSASASGKESAIGLNISAESNASASVEVAGDVSAEGSYAAAVTGDIHNNSEMSVSVDGDLLAEGQYGYGLLFNMVSDQSTADFTVNGDICAHAEKQGEGGSDDAAAVFIGAHRDSSASLSVAGDVTASAEDSATTLRLNANDSELSAVVGGSVKAEAEQASALCLTSSTGGIIDVSIAGDVSSTDTGLWVEFFSSPSDMPGQINVTIEGTLSGDHAPIYVSGDASTDASLTVWKIEPAEDGSVVVPSYIDPADVPEEYTEQVDETNTKLAAAAEVFEKSINYIIRMLQPEAGGTMSTEGTTEQNGFDTAREGDTVTVKLNVADGYQVDAVYGDEGQELALDKDENGNFFLVVPKGGGILLNAVLSLIPAEEPAEEPAPIIVPVQKPAAEPAPAPEKVEIAEASLDSAEATVSVVTVEPAAPAQDGEEKNEETAEKAEEAEEEESVAAPVSAVVKFYDDKSFELVVTTYSAEEPESVDSVERIEGSFRVADGVLTLKLADGSEIELNEDGVFIITLPDGRTIQIKLDQATIDKLLKNA